MSTDVATADRDAQLYDQHWQPVLDAAVGRLLDRIDDHLGPVRAPPGAGPLIIDIGTGTAALLVAAARRWSGARFVGLDPAPGMLARARLRASHAGLPDGDLGPRWMEAAAEAIPLEDGGADRVISSFALQLVRDRPQALREARRILRPGGSLAFVTWMAGDMRIEPDDELDEAVLDLGIDEREPEPAAASAGDYESLQQAEEELRDAGFERRRVAVDELTYAWTRESYLVFKEAFDEPTLFEALDEKTRARLVARIRERWAKLPEEAFTLRAPLISALARRP